MPTTKQQKSDFEDDEPTKGGIKPTQPKPYPSGDSPKRQGDPFKDGLKTEK